MSDYRGEEYQHLEYTPYGETWVEESDNNKYINYKFTGKELDEETGLYYFGARYYDPKTSTWASCDPILGDYLPVAPVSDDAKKHNSKLPGQGGVFNAINLNLYHYAGNNPMKYTDPDGNAFYGMGSDRMKAWINYFLQGSKTFRLIIEKLGTGCDRTGNRPLVIFITNEPGKKSNEPGSVKTSITKLTEDIMVGVLTVDNKGQITTSNKLLKKDTEIQAIIINIDLSKEKGNGPLETGFMIAHEFSHAEEAVKVGAEKYNKTAVEEQSKLKWKDRPQEQRANNSADKIVNEVIEDKKK